MLTYLGIDNHPSSRSRANPACGTYSTRRGFRLERVFSFALAALWFAAVACITPGAAAQSVQPALFVANNGNLEGSVTSYAINPDGSLQFVAKFITGTTPSSNIHNPGTNAGSIALSPDGRHLVTGHLTSSSTTEQLTFFHVNADATLSLIGTFLTADTPIDLEWIDNEYLAVTQTTGGNFILTYRFDPAVPSLTFTGYGPVGATTFYICVDRASKYIYAGSSTLNQIKSFRLNADGSLSSLSTISTGMYPLGMGLSPGADRIYYGGGISSGSHAVGGASINASTGGLVALLSGTPYYSPGVSPKQVVVTQDDRWAFVGHGTDATVRGFAIDQRTGALSSTGVMFDVGGQGDLGNIATMGNLLFALDRYTSGDGVRGAYSFTINADGTLTQNGPLVDSQGVSPWDLVAWPGVPQECVGDVTGDQQVNFDDVLAILMSWGPCEGCPADVTGDGQVNFDDILAVLAEYGPCD